MFPPPFGQTLYDRFIIKRLETVVGEPKVDLRVRVDITQGRSILTQRTTFIRIHSAPACHTVGHISHNSEPIDGITRLDVDGETALRALEEIAACRDRRRHPECDTNGTARRSTPY